MSLIDREALIAEYDRVHIGQPGGARKLMEDAPTVEPERKMGKWIEDRCSECGCYVYHGDVRNFCPNCGSYNGGDNDDQNK